MVEQNRGIAPPVDEDEETEEETGTKVVPNPEEIKKIDASEGQKPLDEWVDGKR